MYPNCNMYNPYFYGFGSRSSRENETTNLYKEELITLNEAIELIKESIGDEKEDEMFYTNLINQAPTENEKNIIMSIRDDEKKHNQILRTLYYNFTGQFAPEDTTSSTNNNNNLGYKEQLEKALFGELDAVVKYRRILGTMPGGDSYTLIMSIMTDEIRHANKYNYLIQNVK